MHEGGELGYSLSHAYGAAFDNPDLLVACVVGDGEAETGPLATSWHSNKFLNPARDGAVLPILHLNGYKIANPTFLSRIPHEELEALFVGYGYTPYFVEGDDPMAVHQRLAGVLDECLEQIRAIQKKARTCRRHRAAAVADDRPAHPEGVDRPEGGRRAQAGGLLASPPGADRRRRGQPGAPEGPRNLDAELRAREAVRQVGPAYPRAAGAGPRGRPPDQREPARQRRANCGSRSSCRTSATTR